MTVESEFNNWQGQELFLFSMASRPTHPLCYPVGTRGFSLSYEVARVWHWLLTHSPWSGYRKSQYSFPVVVKFWFWIQRSINLLFHSWNDQNCNYSLLYRVLEHRLIGYWFCRRKLPAKPLRHLPIKMLARGRSHTSHKDTEQSTIAGSFCNRWWCKTALIKWSPNEWPSVCWGLPHCFPIRDSKKFPGCLISLQNEHSIVIDYSICKEGLTHSFLVGETLVLGIGCLLLPGFWAQMCW
jgi:hypothetical protein